MLDGSQYGVYTSVFNTAGANLTPEFQVNTWTLYAQQNPSVSGLTGTTFVIAWESVGQDAFSSYGVFLKGFSINHSTSTTEIPGFDLFYMLEGFTLLAIFSLLFKKKNTTIVRKF